MRINVLSDPIGPIAIISDILKRFFDNTVLANATCGRNIPYTPV